nr:hypothetical protein [Leptolyngbyaceae cyanobacterium MO_188.B28]
RIELRVAVSSVKPLMELTSDHPTESWGQANLFVKQYFATSIIFAAPTVMAFAQRLRRKIECYQEEPILLKRLHILKEKRFLFTNHLRHSNAPAFSSALDRSMRFLDEKLQSFGQFRAETSIGPMLNAWAIVNNLREFLPDAQKAGQSLAEVFGARLHDIPWMEALNLCTVGSLDKLLLANN